MEKDAKKISLGFTKQQFEPGIHICQIFNNDDERHNALVDFLISGILSEENAACFSEKESPSTLSDVFKKNGIEYKKVEEKGEFSLSGTANIYFKDNKFDPDKMIDLLKDFYEKSLNDNKKGARVIGEMTPEIGKVEGGSRLMEYESKVSMLIRKYPVNAVCQYDARSFDGSTILDILKVHPYMIVKGSVIHNPFYIQPEEILSKNKNSQL
jgi:hypothetical protein